MLAVVQARSGSTRLPRKVLAPLYGRPLILRLLDRISAAREIDGVLVATTVRDDDDELVSVLEDAGVMVRRGPVDDVLRRFLGVVDEFEPEHVVRLTGDNPFVDAATVDLVARAHRDVRADYTTNGLSRTFPHGLNVEVVRASALRALAALGPTAEEREHVTLGLLRRADEFALQAVAQDEDRSELRWTVDLPEDLAWAQEVFSRLQPVDPFFGQEQVMELLQRNPSLRRTMDATP